MIKECSVEGQTFVLVGAGGDIGCAIASAARSGSAKHIVAIGHRMETLEPMLDSGIVDDAFVADATKEEEIHRVFSALLKEGVYPNAVINIIGVHHISPIEETNLEDWDRVMELNVKTAFITTKLSTAIFFSNPHIPVGRKTIVNICSKAATRPMRLSAAYNASKAALRMLSMQSARELSKYKVSVVCLSPGIIRDSQMSWQIMDTICEKRGWTKEHALAYQMEHIPWGEMVTTAQVAAMAMVACGSGLGTLTGAELQITGGQY